MPRADNMPATSAFELRATGELLQRKELVAKLAVERFVGAILPGLAGIDQRRLDLRGGQPRPISSASRSMLRRGRQSPLVRRFEAMTCRLRLPTTFASSWLRSVSRVVESHEHICPLCDSGQQVPYDVAFVVFAGFGFGNPGHPLRERSKRRLVSIERDAVFSHGNACAHAPLPLWICHRLV
jgi:hypothetical protein